MIITLSINNSLRVDDDKINMYINDEINMYIF